MTTQPTCLWPAEWLHLLARIEWVRDDERADADRAAAWVGESAPAVMRLRVRVQELEEVVRRMKDGASKPEERSDKERLDFLSAQGFTRWVGWGTSQHNQTWPVFAGGDLRGEIDRAMDYSRRYPKAAP